ncbi:hypothetical protein J8F10_09075 [Gemmata sp. G18]|uniref:DUF1508 domain-containing protein n=1 Tax=Gemmata palustris TaxID=2822762 RepID=A0ABS5BNX3_9BACT|nr:hypothetical protein [Gemmata palustris]MBP3955432.1 hypothetical protein [Gemmata palustris]
MKFQITKTKQGHVVELLDGNGKPTLRGTRTYARLRDAERAVTRIQQEAMFAPVEAA